MRIQMEYKKNTKWNTKIRTYGYEEYKKYKKKLSFIETKIFKNII